MTSRGVGCGNHILSGRLTTVSTLRQAKLVEQVAVTYSDKLNENGAKTMEDQKEIVTNVKEDDEVYIPIVKNRLLNLEVGANYSDV